MSTPELTAHDVADFLQHNPDFLTQHASVFASLKVPHPHETRAISLGERQILALRARVKDLEWKLAGLVHNASGNERISRTLTDWCALMLAEPDAEKLPGYIVESLTSLFDLPDIALRLWGLDGADATLTQGISSALADYCGELAKPYCGPRSEQPAGALLQSHIASMAVVPLHLPGSRNTVGVLVLGSPDTERFTTDMDTVFLETLGRLAGAALSRLPRRSALPAEETLG
jgi:hypothetical protein